MFPSFICPREIVNMPVTLECEFPGCSASKTADTDATALGLLQLHQANVHNNALKQKAPKVDRPKVSRGVSGEEWSTFKRKWDMFKASTYIGHAELPSQLLACCESDLENALYQNCPNLKTADEKTLLQSIKDLSVIDVAETVRVTELIAMRQEHGESVRSFVARLRGKAHICAFQQVCPKCKDPVVYSDQIVRWVLLAGLASPDISREVLGTTDIDTKSLADTITLIEAKERAARALGSGDIASGVTPTPSVAGISSYKKSQQGGKEIRINCAGCNKLTVKFGKNRKGQTVEYSMCSDCFRASRRRRQNPAATAVPARPESNAAISDAGPVFDVIGGIAAVEPSLGDACENYVYDDKCGWRPGDSKPQPCVELKAAIDHSAYHRLNRSAPPSHPAVLQCVTDTGAQSCLANNQVLSDMGINENLVIPVKRRMQSADQGEIDITGAVFLRLSGTGSNNEQYCARVMVYISPSADAFYLSRNAQEQLKIIPVSFPQVGAAAAVNHTEQGEPKLCDCPTRVLPPGLPDKLPFPATKENTPMMRQWLLDTYAASTFNKCPHQPLPTMTGPPMKVRTDDSCTPSVTKRPARVPIHWKEEVKKQLDRDEALGVIEKVPPGTPVTWLHNMVLTPKADGSPRRTVDLQPLNKVSVRETHHTIPPAQQARSIPKNQVMTVTDAWNGYHSIPIDPEDRHKFTFITEQGRYRYCRAPMGFLASGDAYTHRYDMIVTDIARLLKVVDDSLLYDDRDDREQHWWRVISYLELCGSNGIILNSEPQKFQFGLEEVDFTAFHVSGTEVKPLPKYLDAIRSFPRPSNITDVRAWFGLVNQVAHYSKLVDLMAPFKPLLSPKSQFKWSEELEEAFQQSKIAIMEAISHGVEIYDPQRTTCLQTDYSGTGVGYWLRQKYCSCPGDLPDCCSGGWRVTLAGSRFLRDAEKRYAPIEGECLAVAWALEDTRWFTLGCSKLVVVTDHKPLVKILGDKCLDNLHNPRLFRLKQRTMMWTFDIQYVAGKSNHAADATSRNPARRLEKSTPISDSLAVIRLEPTSKDDMEADIIAGARASMDTSGAISWTDLRSATQADKVLQLLPPLIVHGFPAERRGLPDAVQPYWQYRDRLSVVDGVVMMDARLVIPAALRANVLSTLHAAHQGISGMMSRAHDCVFWPGITGDIEQTRNHCSTCATIAPSHPHMPPTLPITPQYPFQAISVDYFTLKGVKYLITVDRFSGWPHIMRAKYSDEAVGSNGLIKNLKFIFATFGVPDEMSSDGGPEFVADNTQAFLKHWGVVHRLSAAYNSESNGRAEVGVKSMKRLLTGNTRDNGSLDDNRVISGLLQYRNTPEPTTGMSPASILFGRRIKDKIPIPPGTSIYENPHVSPVWQHTWMAREDALRQRFAKQVDTLSAGTRDLGVLNHGTRARLQNLCGPHPKKWDRTGQVLERLPYDQYLVRVDGSGRVVRRNRRHLRQIITLSDTSARTHARIAPPPMYSPRLQQIPSPVPHESQSGAPSAPGVPQSSAPRAAHSPDSSPPMADLTTDTPMPPLEPAVSVNTPTPESPVPNGGHTPTAHAESETDSGVGPTTETPTQPSTQPPAVRPRRACVGQPMYWEIDHVKY